MWANNAGAGLEHSSTEDYGLAVDNNSNHIIISQQCLRSNMLSPWIKNVLTTDTKLKSGYFKTSYTYNNQCDGSTIFFVIVKMSIPDTCAVCSDIKKKMKTMRMSHFKYYIPKSNLHIA